MIHRKWFRHEDSVKLTHEEVMNIADLAKLELTAAEIDQFADQLSAVLDYASRLDQLAHQRYSAHGNRLAVGKRDARRCVVQPSLPREQALANDTDTADGQFRVNAVLD